MKRRLVKLYIFDITSICCFCLHGTLISLENSKIQSNTIVLPKPCVHACACHAYVCMYVRACVCACVRACISACVHICVRAYLRACISACVHICVRAYQRACAYVHASAFAYERLRLHTIMFC